MAPAGKNKEQSAENPAAQGLNTEVACHKMSQSEKDKYIISFICGVL